MITPDDFQDVATEGLEWFLAGRSHMPAIANLPDRMQDWLGALFAVIDWEILRRRGEAEEPKPSCDPSDLTNDDVYGLMGVFVKLRNNLASSPDSAAHADAMNTVLIALAEDRDRRIPESRTLENLWASPVRPPQQER